MQIIKIIVLLDLKTVLNNDILELNCGDLYENVLEKVVLGYNTYINILSLIN